jgi:hypothetical protein
MTTITCKCKSVEIEFPGETDLFRLQCCCHDCTASLRYAAKRGGPRAPSKHWVDSSWLPNDFVILQGEDKIGAFLNFENADTTRFYCTECWTVLFGDHIAYEKKLVVTQIASFTEFDGISDIERMEFQARHFLQDVPEGEVADLPRWAGDPARIYQSVAEVLMESFPDIQERGAAGAEMNAQILLAKIGRPFVPTGDPRLSEGPATLMQQAAAENAESNSI